MKSYLTQSGFTLIELLISIAIIVILSSIGIASFNSSSSKNGVQQRASEIRSLARKLRTDAGSAIKPSGTCTTNGTVYGSYIDFAPGAGGNYYYGMVCFDKTTPANPDYDSQTSATLPTGFTFVPPTTNNLIIFYGFDGTVKFYDSTLTKPDYNLINAGAAIATDPLSLKITDNTNNYYVYFSSTGLVCEQAVVPPGNCAN